MTARVAGLDSAREAALSHWEPYPARDPFKAESEGMFPGALPRLERASL